jgi:hypothetical protein
MTGCSSRSLPWRRGSLCAPVALLCFVASVSAQAQPDAVLPPIGGGGGGQFVARCPQGEVLTGFDLRAGDDIDAIRPICIPAVVGNFQPYPHSYGGGGGSPVQLVCPNDFPVVTGMHVGAEGVNTVTVNNLHLYCGLADATSQKAAFPSAVFDAPKAEANCDLFDCTDTVKTRSADQHCPAGLIAVGISGRAGKWLDAVGLICGAPKVVLPPLVVAMPETGVKAQGRVKLEGVPPGPARPICDLAQAARARNSPAAPGLEAKCAAQESLHVPELAAKGEAIAQQDPLAVELRNQQQDDSARRGFDIGMAAAEGQTLPGPGKQRIHDSLVTQEQSGFTAAVAFSLARNRYADFARKGAAIAQADEVLSLYRSSNGHADALFKLGFDIAMGLFSDPVAAGDAAKGLGSLAVRENLSEAGRRGFDAATGCSYCLKYRP